MNATTQTQNTALAIASDERSQVGSMALVMDPASMKSMLSIAELMAGGKSTIPVHLQKNPADCLAVVMQSMQWGLNPFAVAQKTHIVSGHLGYEAQLVNAVVQSSRSIDGRFHYEYNGNSPAMSCRVGAVIRGESEITWGEWLSENRVTTKNSPLWKTNPKQQLGYLQVKNWARLYCPGAILGVYTPDEFDAPQPRNMGPANVVSETPEVSDDLIAEAKEAAGCGVVAYQTFWKEIGGPNRKALASHHEELKNTAVAADKGRTVDTPDPDTGEIKDRPVVTYAAILAKLDTAANENALNVAIDWANELTESSEVALLNDRYDERLAEIRGL